MFKPKPKLKDQKPSPKSNKSLSLNLTKLAKLRQKAESAKEDSAGDNDEDD